MGDRSIPGQVLGEDIDGLLIDLDGTLYTHTGPIPGAIEALASLRTREVPFRLLTNTTRKSQRAVLEMLTRLGFAVSSDEVLTAVSAASAYLRSQRLQTVAPFVHRDTMKDLKGIELRCGLAKNGGHVDAVLVGDLGDAWSVELLNEAFRLIMMGAQLVALQKNRYWESETGLAMDAGPFVAALEYATGRPAVVCGKPAPEFFRSAVTSMGLTADSSVAMVGDDPWGDVLGAMEAGIAGWQVKTGKYREGVLATAGIHPTKILDSIADIANA